MSVACVLCLLRVFYVCCVCSMFVACVLCLLRVFYVCCVCSMFVACVLCLLRVFYVCCMCSMFVACVLRLLGVFYVCCVCSGKAASIVDLCITQQEFRSRLADFQQYCPVSLALKGQLVNCAQPASLRYAAEFRGKQHAPHTHMHAPHTHMHAPRTHHTRTCMHHTSVRTIMVGCIHALLVRNFP